MHDGGAFSFWRDYAVERYREIRGVQASKLLPLISVLEVHGFADVEGSLVVPTDIADPLKDQQIYLAKSLNYVYLCNYLQPRTMLEIGFNWGYSASLLLEGAPGATLHSVDIAEHWYTRPCGDVLCEVYGDRLQLTWQESRIALQQQADQGRRYDVIVVDGGHAFRTAEADILQSMLLLHPGGIIVIDDTDGPNVRAAVIATVGTHPDFIELTPATFGLFPYQHRAHACFEQMIFLRKSIPCV